MKRRSCAAITVLMLSSLSLGAEAGDLTLSEGDRSELVALLDDSRRQFEELTALSNGEAWSRAPAEGKWSVGEVAEHLVLAEARAMLDESGDDS